MNFKRTDKSLPHSSCPTPLVSYGIALDQLSLPSLCMQQTARTLYKVWYFFSKLFALLKMAAAKPCEPTWQKSQVQTPDNTVELLGIGKPHYLVDMLNKSSFPLNGTDLTGWKQPLYVRCLIIIGYGAVFLLNIVGNPLVCLVVAKNKNMWNVTNFFIVNVALSDFFVGGICMPFTLVNNLKSGWVFGEVMCTILPMLMGMAIVGSVYTLVAIAIDR
uniref:G-protein coupled receptors family 1 profile domain-containing protein n=1 Tax=Branchiostoma floridae TaxID=7739 RepID=C3ZKK7_BRAFL|eukprot:XP_002590909.1 hypothetical protein BRAFLDRAFT_84445 [Branchiostoma floridae]